MKKVNKKINKNSRVGFDDERLLIYHRRDFIKGMFTSFGALGLRSFLLGLPPAFLTKRAFAVENPTFLIYSTHKFADPVNANAPGTYLPFLHHSPELPGVDVVLGDQTYTGSRDWAALPATFRARLQIFHHATGKNIHPEAEDVLRINQSLKGPGGRGVEMLPSAIAQHTAVALGTISSVPVIIGATNTAFTSDGIRLDQIQPRTLKNSLGSAVDVQAQRLMELRDQALDSLYSEIKTSGTVAQKEYLDRHVKSRDEARQLSAGLGNLLADVQGNTQNDAVLAAVAVVASKTAPAAVLPIYFGGDNHGDRGLVKEIEGNRTGIAAMGSIGDRLRLTGMSEQTTYAQLNVFGRSLGKKGNANVSLGRDHNPHHSVMVMEGPKVEPGVTGGIEPISNRDAGQAMGINSQTGGTTGADITKADTLASAAKTLMKACGLEDGEINERIEKGKVVSAAIKA